MNIKPAEGTPVVVISTRNAEPSLRVGRIAAGGRTVAVNEQPDQHSLERGEDLLIIARVAGQKMSVDGRFVGRGSESGVVRISGDWRPADNRKSPRFQVATLVEVRAGGRLMQAVLRDISFGGARLEFEQAVDAGSFSLVLRNGGFSASVPCRSVSSGENPDGSFRVGVQFEEAGLGLGQLAFLRGYLKDLARAEGWDVDA